MQQAFAYREKFRSRRVCVLIPTYNNAGTLAKVISDVLEYTDQVIVVNDGSTDTTNDILKQFPSVDIVSYAQNQGKGWALRKGFERALALGYEYAITIDSDGQHFASDLPAFIDKLEQDGPALVIGARNMEQEGIPGKSSFGNRFSNFWFRAETGITAPDTQSGYRLYPIALLRNMRFFTRKYEFEIEVIVRAAWKGIPVTSVPVKVYYAPGSARVSHFRPFRDFSRISVLNTVLVFLTIFYINPANFLRALFSVSTYRNLRKDLHREIFSTRDSPMLKSASIAFGVFMGIFPVWGFQLLIGIFLAVLFRLNKSLFLISAHISIPPMIPLIIYLSYKMGALWTEGHAHHLDLSSDITLHNIHDRFIQYLYGSIALAVLAGLLAGVITYVFLTIRRRGRAD